MWQIIKGQLFGSWNLLVSVTLCQPLSGITVCGDVMQEWREILQKTKWLNSSLRKTALRHYTGFQTMAAPVQIASSSLNILSLAVSLQWYGHVKRMPEVRIPELIMEWIPMERRKRGRPRKTWMEAVQAAMTTRNLEPDQWRNREEWRLVSGTHVWCNQ